VLSSRTSSAVGTVVATGTGFGVRSGLNGARTTPGISPCARSTRLVEMTGCRKARLVEMTGCRKARFVGVTSPEECECGVLASRTASAVGTVARAIAGGVMALSAMT